MHVRPTNRVPRAITCFTLNPDVIACTPFQRLQMTNSIFGKGTMHESYFGA